MSRTSRAIREDARARREELVKEGVVRPQLPSVRQLHDSIVVPKIREEVPLHLYLTEQVEPVARSEVDAQTDEFLEEPEEPAYIPRKTGVDVDTQVDNAMVFNFDKDVQPILEVVISKILSQSLTEVREEMEMSSMKGTKAQYERKFTAEEQQRKEKLELEREAYEKKEAMVKKARDQKRRQLETQNRMAAGQFARSVVKDLQMNVIGELRKTGHFSDPMKEAAEKYLNFIYERVADKVKRVESTRELLDEMLRAAVDRTAAQQNQLVEQAVKDSLRREQEYIDATNSKQEVARMKKTKLQLFINSPDFQAPVGPIHLSGSSTVKELEDKVYAWVHDHSDIPPERERLIFDWAEATPSPNQELWQVGFDNAANIRLTIKEIRVSPVPSALIGETVDVIPEEDEEDER